MKLTDRQKEILDYIYKFIQVNQYPPSCRNIGSHFKITVKGVHDHLVAIEKKGYIERVDNANRSIKLSEKYFLWLGYEEK
jgi:repressor LexA